MCIRDRWGLAAVTLAVAAAVALLVRDPAKLGDTHPKGSLAELLRVRALWLMLPLLAISYAVSACIRGLWAAPYLAEVYGADAQTIGRATLAMGMAMVIGNFLVGPATRLVRGPRRMMMIATAGTMAVLAALALWPGAGLGLATALLALIGLAGTSYAVQMTHARPFLPPHLIGRGVTFLNMISIAGVGAMQFASRPVYRWAAEGRSPDQVFSLIFLFFLIPLTIGFLIYFLTPEAPDA